MVGDAKAEASAFVHARLFPATTLAFAVSGGTSSGGVGFDLRSTEDRSVRSGYGETDLIAADFLLGSVELRQRLFAASLPPGFACELEAFLFADAAGLGHAAGGLTFADAYGVGVRALLDNPIFAYFTFTYGVSHLGQGRLAFAATAGF
jgi:hypothetical protein